MQCRIKGKAHFGPQLPSCRRIHAQDSRTLSTINATRIPTNHPPTAAVDIVPEDCGTAGSARATTPAARTSLRSYANTAS
jgi:hypothetical protein